MHLLFLTDNFPPEVNAPATRTMEHCQEWVRRGAEVTVVTGFPNFPQGKVYPGYRNRWFKVERVGGIRVVRVWTYIAANEGFRKRVLDYLSFALMGWLAGLFIRTDLIIATSPQFFTALGGYLSSVFKRRPWVMEVRDLWPESIRAVNALPVNARLFRLLEGMELFFYKKARGIVVVTDSFRENLIARGIPADKIGVVKNGVYLHAFSPRAKDEALLRALNLNGKFIIGYLGTHGMAHGLDFILNCAQTLQEEAPSVHFLFVGDGAEKKKLLDLQQQLGLRNATLLDAVPKEEISRYISIIDVALVPLKKSDTFKTVIPSKIFENAAMEKPILLGVEGESKAIVESYGAGICFDPENKADFIQKTKKLAFSAPLYASCVEGCRALAADFDRKALAGKMLDFIRGCV